LFLVHFDPFKSSCSESGPSITFEITLKGFYDESLGGARRIPVPRVDAVIEISAEDLHDGIPSRVISRALSRVNIVSTAHASHLFACEFLFHIRRNIREEQYAGDMILNKKKVLDLK
jgi:hypothetical protein